MSEPPTLAHKVNIPCTELTHPPRLLLENVTFEPESETCSRSGRQETIGVSLLVHRIDGCLFIGLEPHKPGGKTLAQDKKLSVGFAFKLQEPLGTIYRFCNSKSLAVKSVFGRRGEENDR